MLEENKTFHEEDVFKLVNLIPRAWYRSEDSFKLFLEDTVELGEELKDILNLYPDVLCEPLDNYYLLLRALGTISEDLIFDLCTFNPQKCAAFAAFLTCLKPEESFKKYLTTVKGTLAHKSADWIIELAIAEINGVSWQLFPEISLLLHNLRNLFKGLNIPKVEMRKMWTSEEIEAFAEKQLMVKKVYKEQGTDAALAMIKQLKLSQ
jgi:hypothetical protein